MNRADAGELTRLFGIRRQEPERLNGLINEADR